MVTARRSLPNRVAVGLLGVAALAGPGAGVAPSPAAAQDPIEIGEEEEQEEQAPVWVTTVVDRSVGTESSVALHRGMPRVAYVSNAGEHSQSLGYAWCDATCTESESWERTVRFHDAPVERVSLAVDPRGTAHMAFRSTSSGTLNYISSRDARATTSLDLAAELSLALDSGGRPRIAYTQDHTDPRSLRLASCDGSCQVGSWTTATIKNDDSVWAPQLAYVGMRPRIVYSSSSGEVLYGACEQHCLSPWSWGETQIGQLGSAKRSAALIIDGDRVGVAHLSQSEQARTSGVYLGCPSSCTSGSSWWTGSGVFGEAVSHLDVAFAPGGPRVVTVEDGDVFFHACDAGCGSSDRWERRRISRGAQGPASIALDGEQPVVSVVVAGDGQRELHVVACRSGCGEPGVYDDPPPRPLWSTSTSTHDPDGPPPTSTSIPNSSSPPSTAIAGSRSVSRAVPEEHEEQQVAEGPVPASRELHLRDRLPRATIPAEDGPETAARPHDDGIPFVPLTGRGTTVAAVLAALVFASLGLLAYRRIVRPVAAWHRKLGSSREPS